MLGKTYEFVSVHRLVPAREQTTTMEVSSHVAVQRTLRQAFVYSVHARTCKNIS